MALRFVVSSKMPIVIILGATGTGKTKLGVELAQRFNTEIISADSMQIYKGLDVVTAKATAHERSLVPHHLLDILEPHQMFTVVDFKNRALKIIDKLMQDGKIPIVVGGTNYYIESIVYRILVENMDDADALLWDVSRRKRDEDDTQLDKETASKRICIEPTDSTDCRTKINTDSDKFQDNLNVNEASVSNVDDHNVKVDKEMLAKDVNNEKVFTNEQIHDKLKMIDPVMAARLHPNNRRKVLRSIEVWLKSGRRHSDILAEQKKTEGCLRMPDSTLIFWLTCDQKVHDARLDARVDTMLQEGLIAELLDFHERHNRQRMVDNQPPDYTKGVFQTLGFKEFHEYLLLPEEARNSESGQKLLEVCVENMKIATRRYARRQNKMIRGRFLEHPRREIPKIYGLDTTDLTKWDEEVRDKSIHIVESHMNGDSCKFEPIKSVISEDKREIDGNSRNYCETCDRIIIGDMTYKIHMKSIKHSKVLKKKKKLEESIKKQNS